MKNGIREQGAVHCRLPMTDVVDAMFKKRMQIKWLIKSVASLLVMAVLLSCDRHEKYEVVDSGIHALDDWPVYWIDNNTVIFIGYEMEGTIKDVSHALSFTYGIYVWEIGKGVRRHADSTERMCYDHGFISYDIKKENPAGTGRRKHLVLMEGQFPNEVETPYPTREPGGLPFDYHNKFTCKLMQRPLMKSGRTVIPLRDEHGTLFVEDPRVEPNAVPKLIKPDGSDVLLSASRWELYEPNLFDNVKQAYFSFPMHPKNVRNEGALSSVTGSWLYPDGRLELFSIEKPIAFASGSLLAFPMKIGVVYASHHGKSETDPFYSGLYIVSGGANPERIIGGIVRRAAVSPDGCRLAFGNAATLKDRQQGRSKMKMIDFCNN